MGVRARRVLSVLLVVILAAGCFAMLVLPLPQALSLPRETYRCVWANGETEELYAMAFRDLVGIGEDGAIELAREGKLGKIIAGEEFLIALSVLRSGDLFALYNTLDVSRLTRLERAALFRTFGETVWYTNGAFCFDGTRLLPCTPAYAREVVLLEGSLPKKYLKSMAATALRICEKAEIAAADFVGSKIEKIEAEPPFYTDGVGIYRETAGGTRLVAALPCAETLTVGDCDYADEGALLPCAKIRWLSVPFAGNAMHGGSEEDGTFGWLFQTKNGYTMPATLTSITVRGGKLVAFCFYGCDFVESIDVCGLNPADISQQAFLSVTGLRSLHTPRADVLLEGNYSAKTADCGCTVFERTA